MITKERGQLKYNIRSGKMFTKSDLKTGMMAKNRRGDILMYLDLQNTKFRDRLPWGGVFLGIGGCNMSDYNEDLTNDTSSDYDIIEVREPKDVLSLDEDNLNLKGNLLWKRSELKQITSLDRLEEVRKELCKKYNTDFYISNKRGEWEIKYNGLEQIVGFVNSESKTLIYFDWEVKNGITTDLYRPVDLEKEGYEVRIK